MTVKEEKIVGKMEEILKGRFNHFFPYILLCLEECVRFF